MNLQLTFEDWLVTGFILFIPLVIGVIFAIRDSKRVTREEYLMGGRNMAMLPVAVSIFVTFQSAVSLMGIPTEIYTFGSMIFANYIGISLAYVVGLFIMVPLMYPLQMTSVYEYMEKRFQSKLVRRLSTAIGMLQSLFYMAIVLLAPALALQSAAGIDLWVSIAIVGGVGTVYSSLGGLKSIVWTDAFQCVVIFMGIIITIIKGSLAVGDFGTVWSIAEEGGRTKLDKVNPDLRERHTWWSMVLGGFFMWMVNIYNQSTIPFESGAISNRNQVAPYFVVKALRDTPGIAGLFIATLFSAGLSTVSSGICALAANTVEDFLKACLKDVSEKTATIITKALVASYGLITIGLAFGASSLDGPVTQLAASVFGSLGSPILGVFLTGTCIPWVNSVGAISGGVVSLAFNLWIAIGSRMYGKPSPPLAAPPTDGCYSSSNDTLTDFSRYNNNSSFGSYTFNMTLSSGNSTTGGSVSHDSIYVYDISYEWYAVLGTLISVIVCLIVSLSTRSKFSTKVNPKFLMPSLRKFWNESEYTEEIETRTFDDKPEEMKYLRRQNNNSEQMTIPIENGQHNNTGGERHPLVL